MARISTASLEGVPRHGWTGTIFRDERHTVTGFASPVLARFKAVQGQSAGRGPMRLAGVYRGRHVKGSRFPLLVAARA